MDRINIRLAAPLLRAQGKEAVVWKVVGKD
jgi:hypothetical protein